MNKLITHKNYLKRILDNSLIMKTTEKGGK